MNRYIEIDAYNIGTGELPTYVPFWDSTHLTFKLDDDYCEWSQITVTSGFRRLQSTKVTWDMLTQKIIDPVEVIIKVPLIYIKCVIGDTLAYEAEHRKLRISKLVDITYDGGQVESEVVRGDCLNSVDRETIGTSFDQNWVYKVSRVSPVFVFEDGSRIRYEHKLYNLLH